jgi:hypothetical protein
VAAAVPRKYCIVKEQLKSVIQPIAAQTSLTELPLSIAALVIQKLKPYKLNEELELIIHGQISDLDDQHAIYKLLWRRVSDFLGEISLPTTPAPPETPKGLQNIQSELAQIASAFGKLCSLNRQVFGPIYSKLIKDALVENSTPLTPRKNKEVEQMARTPDSPRHSSDSTDQPPKPTGLTPRKEKPQKRHDQLDLD